MRPKSIVLILVDALANCVSIATATFLVGCAIMKWDTERPLAVAEVAVAVLLFFAWFWLMVGRHLYMQRLFAKAFLEALNQNRGKVLYMTSDFDGEES